MEAFCDYFYNDYDNVQKKFKSLDGQAFTSSVFSINFKDLLNYKALLSVGDPVICEGCKGILNKNSQILTPAEYTEKYGVESTSSIWACEFCGHHNKLTIQKEELPKENDNYYLIKSAAQIVEEKDEMKKSADVPKDLDSDSSIIFCLDISGSMDCMENGVSRLNGVKAAILDQIKEIEKTYPNRKIGIVLFGSEVTIIGDGLHKPQDIGRAIRDFDQCKTAGQKAYATHMTKTIKDCSQGLQHRVHSIHTNGGTALGPGLLASVGMVMQATQGSQVILCTDGLANEGFGDLQNMALKEASKAFYTKVANIAKDCGSSISIITMKSCGSEIDVLGKVCEITNGNVMRVDPTQIGEDFGKAIADEIVGTKVVIEVHLHGGLRFKNVPEKDLSENGSILRREVGNVTMMTEFSFEYDMKSKEELKMAELDVEKLKEIPFQAQVTFTSKKGDQCIRVINMLQKTTKEDGLAEKTMKLRKMMRHGQQIAADQALKGQVHNAKAQWQSHKTNMRNVKQQQKEAKVLRSRSNSECSDMEEEFNDVESLVSEEEYDDFECNMEEEAPKRKTASAPRKQIATKAGKGKGKSLAEMDKVNTMLYNKKMNKAASHGKGGKGKGKVSNK